jgi:UDP-N-acetylglucosamine--N-acetylmuramyl-(pentapeptide) pyrophosphoryl-undecaprenol N-acetylglucosamine transferase
LNEKRLSILFAGGGTGGHLYPALAIAEEIRKRRPDAAITFAGARGKIEEREVPERGFEFAPLWISGLSRRFSAGTVLFPLKVLVAIWQSYRLIRREKPDVVVGTGGYVSGAPVFVAWLLGLPTMIQEQNSYPGITTRLMASRVREVHLTFERSARYLSRKDNIHFSGNPTQAAIGKPDRQEGARHLGVDPSGKTLLVTGGSQGAASINSALLGALDALVADGTQIVWAVGTADYERVEGFVRELQSGARRQVHLHRYIGKMQYAYAAADLAVTRAGATTLAELARAAVPSVLVPYPYAAADHQTENAEAMVESGASVLCRNNELDRRLLEIVRALLKDSDTLRRMSENARRLSRPDAAEELATAVERLVNA